MGGWDSFKNLPGARALDTRLNGAQSALSRPNMQACVHA